jgi:hypothetical protein
MLKGTTELSLEVLLISALNVAAVYVAAFTYKLEWVGVMTVMVLASLFTAGLTHFVLSKLLYLKNRAEPVISEGVGVIIVALLSSLAVLAILTRRFNLPQALGIALLSGMLSSFIRHLLE